MIIKCPACFADVEYLEGECEFCPECGNELKSPPGDDPVNDIVADVNCLQQSDPGEVGKFMPDDADLQIPEHVSFGSAGENDEFSGLSIRSRMIADEIDSFGSSRSFQGECPYLKVEYNRNQFFLTEMQAIVKLKLTPLTEQLHNILVFMETESDGKPGIQMIPVREVLKKDRFFLLQTPFNPGERFGKKVFTFYVGCKIDGAFIYYQFFVEHTIYNSKQSDRAFANQISIKINQEFTTNHAADINYRDSIGEALKEMKNKALTANEMIDRLNELPPKYEVQRLAKTMWRPEETMIKGNLYPTDKLLIEYGDREFYLISKHEVKFGWNPDYADLLVRCGRGKLGRKDYPNSTVSKKHAEIKYCNDTVTLLNRSSHGTYIRSIHSAGEAKKVDSEKGITLESNVIVEFGDIHWKMNIQCCKGRLAHNICQTCTADKVKSVVFTRLDKEPEYYLLIWQCCELGRVIEELSDWTIFSRNGYFFIRTPEQEFYHLRPGTTIQAGEKQLKVKYFKQR